MTEPAYLQIAASLRSRIQSGELAPGALLPTTKELCHRHWVGPMTVRRGIAVLIEEGLVETRQGVGTWVAERKAEVAVNEEEADALLGRDWGPDWESLEEVPPIVPEATSQDVPLQAPPMYLSVRVSDHQIAGWLDALKERRYMMRHFESTEAMRRLVMESGRAVRKKATSVVYLQRVDGPFEVVTPEGLLRCRDGYLALDPVSGTMWPVSAIYADLHYEEVPGDS